MIRPILFILVATAVAGAGTVPAAAGPNNVIADSAPCSTLSQDNVAFARALMTALIDKNDLFNEDIRRYAADMSQFQTSDDPGEQGLQSMVELQSSTRGMWGESTAAVQARAAALVEARREAVDLVPSLVKACAEKPNANLLDTIQEVTNWR